MLRKALFALVGLAIGCGPTRESESTDPFTLDLTKLHDGPAVRDSLTATNSGVPYVGTECFSRYIITSDAPSITVRSLTDLVSFAGGYNATGLVVNGTPQGAGSQLGATGSVLETTYTLPAGSNTIELINGPCGETAVGVTPIRYTPILGYSIPHGSTHSVVSPTAPTKRIVPMGDSLTIGAFPDTGPNQASVFQAWPVLMRVNALASVSGAYAGARLTNGGSGGRRWQDEASSAPLITASMAKLALQLDGTGNNLALPCLGTNDWSSGVSVVTLTAWINAWGTAFTAAFPTANCVLVSPTKRSSEGTPNAGGATMPQIRTAIQACAVTNGFGYIDGSLLVPTFNSAYYSADNVHLTTLGMSTFESNIRAALVALSLGY